MTKPTNHYTGVTAYLKQNHKTEARLRLLAEAIPALQAHVDMNQLIPKSLDGIQKSGYFGELSKFSYLFAQDGYPYPSETPEAYQSPSITDVTIKSQTFTRLHLPLLDTRQSDIDFTVLYLLYPMLDRLFANDLVSLKSRRIDESGSFSEAPELIIVSTEDQKTRSA